jgi:hypothetical protein
MSRRTQTGPDASVDRLEQGFTNEMAFPQSTAVVSLALAAGVTLVAGVLTLRQHKERRRRDPDLSEDDARYYTRQDVRRALVGVVMVLLAVGIAVGSRIDPARANLDRAWFLAVWLIVFGLILFLLLLALLDWIATWLYGRRHYREIARERREFFRDARRRRRPSYGSNGQGAAHDPLEDP